MNQVQAGRGGKAPCRQTIWRRKRKEQERRGERAAEALRTGVLEGERVDVEGSNQEGEQIAEAQVEQQGLDLMEDLSEEVVNEEDIEEVENQDNEDLAEAIGSWPVLSKYQSTRFQYQILTKGMFRSSGFSGLKLIANTCLGIHNMRKLLKSKRRAPKG